MDLKPFLITLLCLCVSAEWDCTTYNGSKGECVVLDKCESLKSTVMGPKPDKNSYEILKKYICGYAGRDPKVCCPEEIIPLNELINGKDCVTPHGEPGTCTKLENCSSMAGQLGKTGFVSEEIMEFIKRSKCSPPGSSKSFNVCCKSDIDSRSPSPLPNKTDKKCVLTAIPPEYGSNCCGIESSSDPRIIGGTEAAIDQFPWLVLIEYTRVEYSCGGFLISGKYVLTAAHCLIGARGKDRRAISVRIGEYNTTKSGPDCVIVAGGGEDCTDGEKSIPIESYVVHEGYTAENVLQHNDIALIRLKELVSYTDFIRPICLPKTDFSTASSNPINLYISGWGVFDQRLQESSDIKLFAKVPYVNKEDCNTRYKKYGRDSLIDSQLCVGGEADRDSCKGDSGGPLMLLQNITYEAAGVISFGPKTCGLENWPSIYTKVYDYMDWIMSKIKP